MLSPPVARLDTLFLLLQSKAQLNQPQLLAASRVLNQHGIAFIRCTVLAASTLDGEESVLANKLDHVQNTTHTSC